HEFPMGSIIRQFSLMPSLLSRRTTVTKDDNDQPQSARKSQDKGNTKRRTRRTWTLEEDIILYSHLQKNQQIVDFYLEFPGRSMSTLYSRVRKLRNAYFLPPEKGGLVHDPDMPIDQRVEGLRRIMRQYTLEQSKEEGIYAARAKSKDLEFIGRYTFFSDEEKELLAELVYKYRDDSDIWLKVSGGRLVDEEGAPRLNRSPQSCKAAWNAMNKDESINLGRWDKYEQRRLEKAIRSQVGDEEIRYDVNEEGPDKANQSVTAASKPTTKPALKMGNSVLQELDWKKIARKVGTRNATQSQNHFYYVMHNGTRGSWTATEMESLKEGFELYGRQWDKIAAHIGSRSISQVRIKHSKMLKESEK
ncbi:hypothetical protein BGX21_004098, partial [Mortierella sp. AD011]